LRRARGRVALESATGLSGEAGRQAGSALCACRNPDQLGPIRRGAGPRREPRTTLAIVAAETLIASFSSSPWMRI
jgi:hypothetical protein